MNQDCQNVILSYLCYVDQLSYKMTNKSNFKLITLDFKKLFIDKLLECQVVPSYQLAKQFCKQLYQTGAKVAGSFILDILYNTNFHNDIDVYTKTNYNENNCPTKCYIHNNIHFSHHSAVEDYFDSWDDHRMQFLQYLYQAKFECIVAGSTPDIRIRSYIHQSLIPSIREKYKIAGQTLHNIDNDRLEEIKHSLQIIPIAMPIRRFITNTFDLEICQNYFDGKHVYLKNLTKLFKKYDYIKPNTKFMFNIYLDNKEKSHDSVLERMIKYDHRGFNIKLHPQYEIMDKEIDNLVKDGYVNDRNYDIFKHIINGSINLSKYDL